MLVDTLRNAEIDKNINFVIYGAGSLGSQILENLVKMGFENIIVYDHDIVESHNISSTIYNNHMIGQLKIDACSNIIKNRYGIEIATSTIDGHYNLNADIPTIFISATDNYNARYNALTSMFNKGIKHCAFIDCRSSAWESNIMVLVENGPGSSINRGKAKEDIQALQGGTSDSTGLSKGCGTKVVTQTGVHIVNAMVTQVVLELNQSFHEDETTRGTFLSDTNGFYKRIVNHRHAGLIFGNDTWGL